MAVRAALRRVVAADDRRSGRWSESRCGPGSSCAAPAPAAAGACLAAVGAVAAGVPRWPLLARPRRPRARRAGSSRARAARARQAAIRLSHGAAVVPAQIPAGSQVPATAKSVASLLLAVMPAGQRPSYLAAASQQDRSAVASIDVQTGQASGSVQVQMGRPGGARLQSCAAAGPRTGRSSAAGTMPGRATPRSRSWSSPPAWGLVTGLWTATATCSPPRSAGRTA